MVFQEMEPPEFIIQISEAVLLCYIIRNNTLEINHRQ